MFPAGPYVTAQTATGQEPAASSKSRWRAIRILNYCERIFGYTKIDDARLALIKEYAENWGTVTDEQALDYLNRSQEISESVIQLWKKYVPLVTGISPGKKTATFFQLERLIELLMDVQVAPLLPLVQSQGQ